MKAKRNTGNQHASRKVQLMDDLHNSRFALSFGDLELARMFLGMWRTAYARVPASTRRRWRCGN